MHLFSVFTLLCFVLGQCGIINAAHFWILGMHDDHPDKCYINENVILAPGEKSQSPEECGLYTCQEPGVASYVTCGTLIATRNDPIEEDSFAAYPRCCPINFGFGRE